MPIQPGDILHGESSILTQTGRAGWDQVRPARDRNPHKDVAIQPLIAKRVGGHAMP